MRWVALVAWLTCPFALAGAALGDTAAAPLVSTCEQWGTDSPGPLEMGIRLGARLGEIKKPIKETSLQRREFDDLPFLLVVFDGFDGPRVKAIRCDAGEPIIIGKSVGEMQARFIRPWKPVEGADWKKSELADLGRATGRRIVIDENPNRILLWSAKMATPVPGSAATDYVILRRDCVLAVKGPNPRLCAATAWSVVRMRSLVNSLLTD